MGDTEHTVLDELDEPRESHWYDAGLGRQWHYFQYRPGDRVVYTGNRSALGTVVRSPNPDGVTWILWADQTKESPIGAWNLRPAHLTITEDPV